MSTIKPSKSSFSREKVTVNAQEARCHCGHLVAKLRKEGVELKCKRCKRIVILPLDSQQPYSVNFAPCHG